MTWTFVTARSDKISPPCFCLTPLHPQLSNAPNESRFNRGYRVCLYVEEYKMIKRNCRKRFSCCFLPVYFWFSRREVDRNWPVQNVYALYEKRCITSVINYCMPIIVLLMLLLCLIVSETSCCTSLNLLSLKFLYKIAIIWIKLRSVREANEPNRKFLPRILETNFLFVFIFFLGLYIIFVLIVLKKWKKLN